VSGSSAIIRGETLVWKRVNHVFVEFGEFGGICRILSMYMAGVIFSMHLKGFWCHLGSLNRGRRALSLLTSAKNR
jgi:hypothetical protein